MGKGSKRFSSCAGKRELGSGGGGGEGGGADRRSCKIMRFSLSVTCKEFFHRRPRPSAPLFVASSFSSPRHGDDNVFARVKCKLSR